MAEKSQFWRHFQAASSTATTCLCEVGASMWSPCFGSLIFYEHDHVCQFVATTWQTGCSLDISLLYIALCCVVYSQLPVALLGTWINRKVQPQRLVTCYEYLSRLSSVCQIMRTVPHDAVKFVHVAYLTTTINGVWQSITTAMKHFLVKWIPCKIQGMGFGGTQIRLASLEKARAVPRSTSILTPCASGL